MSLDLERGKVDLNGQEALALARTRENLKDPSEGDPERAQRQQLILAGIQDRLTSPTRIPYNLLHAPWIAWNAPKAMVSDMGGLTLPQLGDGGRRSAATRRPQILKPSGATRRRRARSSTRTSARRPSRSSSARRGRDEPAVLAVVTWAG